MIGARRGSMLSMCGSEILPRHCSIGRRGWMEKVPGRTASWERHELHMIVLNVIFNLKTLRFKLASQRYTPALSNNSPWNLH